LDSSKSDSQDPPLQQPEHDEPPHVHAPKEHASPLLQGLQLAPAAPHCVMDCEAYGTHVLPLQQPPGHEVASHTHLPLGVHSWPVAHGPQVAPPVPHEPFDSEANASQVPLVPPTQQPFGQVFGSHEQRPSVVSHRPFAHAAQAAPPAPHSEADCEEARMQVAPLQQPKGHEVASQAQRPVRASHSWPDSHRPHAAPPVPHEVFDSDA